VGNVLLDVQIDRGKRLTIDALVVDDLPSSCLIAWKDMQRAGIIFPSFPAKVHVTKTPVCTVPKISDTGRKCTVPKISDTRRKCTVPKSPDMGRKCTVPKSSDMSRKVVNMTDKLNKRIISPNMVKQTVTASTAGQSKGLCLKPNLTTDTLDSLLKEFKDVFEADKITPLNGSPMQIHLNRDDPSYRSIRVSHHRKVPLHFQEEADKTLKWFLDSGVIVPVPPTENVEWVSPVFFCS
jgi:hypothetical protein